MKKIRRMLVIVTVLSVLMTTFSPTGGITGVSADVAEVTELNYDDFYYGKITVGEGDSVTESCYIMGIKKSSAVQASDKTNFYPYKIIIPSEVKLVEADLTDELGSGYTREVPVYVSADTDITATPVTSVAKGAFNCTWSLPSTNADDSMAGGTKFTDWDKNVFYIEDFVVEGNNLTSMATITQYFNYTDGTGTAFEKENLQPVFEFTLGPAEFVIPDSVTTVGGKLMAQTGGAGNTLPAKRVKTIKMGKNLKLPAAEMFRYCGSVEKVYTYAEKLYQNTFQYMSAVKEFHFMNENGVIPTVTRDGTNDSDWATLLNGMQLNGKKNDTAVYTSWWDTPVKVYVPDKKTKFNFVKAVSDENESLKNEEGTTSMFQTYYGKNATSKGEEPVPLFNSENVIVEGSYTLYGNDMTDSDGTKYRLKYTVTDLGTDFSAVLGGFDKETDGYAVPNKIDLTIPGVIYDKIDEDIADGDDETTDSNKFAVKISEIAEKAFAADTLNYDGVSNNALENVVVSEGIKKINTKAFSNNVALKTISLPSTLTLVGQKCFENAQMLYDVNISPEGTERLTLDYESFRQCHRLRGIVLPERVYVTVNAFSESVKGIEFIVLLGQPSFQDSGSTKCSFTAPASGNKIKVYMSEDAYNYYKNTDKRIDESDNMFGSGTAVKLGEDEVLMFKAAHKIVNDSHTTLNVVRVSASNENPVTGSLLMGEYSDDNILNSVSKIADISLSVGIKTYDITDKIGSDKVYKAFLFDSESGLMPLCQNIDIN